MWPDRVSNPGPLALETDVLPTGLRSLAYRFCSLKVSLSMALFKKHYKSFKPNYKALQGMHKKRRAQEQVTCFVNKVSFQQHVLC